MTATKIDAFVVRGRETLRICLSEAMIMKDGKYRMCSTSPEQSALHETGAIRGGVDTVHRRERVVGHVYERRNGMVHIAMSYAVFICCFSFFVSFLHLLLVHCVLRWSVSSGSLCDLFICCLCVCVCAFCDVLVCFVWFIV